jgi:hypothetical protein
MIPLTVLVAIKPGAEQQLRQILGEINKDLTNNPYMQLGKSTRTHFARFHIVRDPDPGVPLRLLYYCDHDGNLYDYIEDMLAISPGLDALWDTCEGYDGREDFAWFIRRNAQENQDVFAGFPKQTVQQVHGSIAIRQQIEQLLSLKDIQLYLADPGIKQLLDLLDQISRGRSPFQRLWGDVCQVLNGIGGVIHDIALDASLRLAEWYGSIGISSNFPLVPSECVDLADRQRYLQHLLELENVEDSIPFVQNPMTVYAEIKPGLYHQLRLRLAMFLAAYVITFGWPPGEFSGVYTLHSFNWLLLDKGRRLVFMSNFDNSPQNYLGDFLDKLDWGLNVFYGNCVGYPEGGMRQVDPFYQWIRMHQLTTLVYYSAYPKETVLNIMRDQQIGQPIAQNIDPRALQDWLRML